MLSKRAKKGIIYGFLGGVVGFVIASFLFTLSCALAFKAGWNFPIYPIQILVVGAAVAFIFLFFSVILKFKRFGILTALIIFLISYIGTLNLSRKSELPIQAREMPILWMIGWIITILVWIMFIIAGIKRGISIANKNNK